MSKATENNTNRSVRPLLALGLPTFCHPALHVQNHQHIMQDFIQTILMLNTGIISKVSYLLVFKQNQELVKCEACVGPSGAHSWLLAEINLKSVTFSSRMFPNKTWP